MILFLIFGFLISLLTIAVCFLRLIVFDQQNKYSTSRIDTKKKTTHLNTISQKLYERVVLGKEKPRCSLF